MVRYAERESSKACKTCARRIHLYSYALLRPGRRTFKRRYEPQRRLCEQMVAPHFRMGNRYSDKAAGMRGRAEAGSAGRGHTLATQGAMSGQASYRSEKEAALSLGALRLQHQSWKQLNDALEEIAQGSSPMHSPPEVHADAANPVAANLDRRARKVTDDLREHQLTADARLIGALLGSSLLPNAAPTTTPNVE